MPRTNILTKQMKTQALRTIAENKLIFLLADTQARKRLSEFVIDKNTILYGKAEFTLIKGENDPELIVAGVPELGENELGLFAGRDFKAGEIITTYNGKNLWGRLPATDLKKKIALCDESGDYFWEVTDKDGISMAIDSSIEGNVARFVNDSLHRNVLVEVKDGTLLYKAMRNIKFGEEITTSYGSDYFNDLKPKISYIPQTLQTILGKLLELNNIVEVDLSLLTSQLAISNMLDLLGWNQAQLPQGKKEQPHTIDYSDLPEERNDTNLKNLFLDSGDNSLLFDLSSAEDLEFLSKKQAVTFEPTSTYKLFVAPTTWFFQKRRFSLFAGEDIKKDTPVCIIKGEKLGKKEIAQRTDIEDNLLFTINSTTNLYCKNYGSEALFVQGVSSEPLANVMLSLKKGQPTYIATKDIPAKSEIVAFYGKDYPHAEIPSSLDKVVYRFNENQLVLDAWLRFDKKSRSYSLNYYPHIMTPGRGIDFNDSPKDLYWSNPHTLSEQTSHSPIQTPRTPDYIPLYEEMPVHDDDDKKQILGTQPVQPFNDGKDLDDTILSSVGLELASPTANSYMESNWQPTHFKISGTRKHNIELQQDSKSDELNNLTDNSKKRCMWNG